MTPEVTGPIDDLVERKLRAGARQFVNALTAQNVGHGMTNAVVGLRQLWHALQPEIDRQIERLAVYVADPANEQAVTEWVKSVLLPPLDPPILSDPDAHIPS